MRILLALILVVSTHAAYALNPPQIVNATISGSNVSVNWSVADPLAWGHNIYRNGSYVGTSYETFYTDEGVPTGSYRYTVSAFANNQYSGQSSEAIATIGGNSTSASNVCTPDNSGTFIGGSTPTTPGNFRAVIYSQSSFELLWDRSTDDGYISTYELKRDGVTVSQRDATSFYEGNVASGRSYSYELVAIDNSGNRSPAATLSVNPLSGSSSNTGTTSPSTPINADWPSNNREASGRSVIALQGSSNGFFYANNRRYVSIDPMPDEGYFTNKGDWTCSYYGASGAGFIIEPTYRSSTWTFSGGGSGTYNGTPITWSLNNTDMVMANMFFDLVEVDRDSQYSGSQLSYQHTIRFWEAGTKFFECQASSNNR